MSKNVLAVYYSQTGQMTAVMDRIITPLRASGEVNVTSIALDVVPPYPYPWPFWQFLDAFPETVQLAPPPLANLQLTGNESFDLIILGYPPWFLSPPPPVTAFLQHPAARRVLKGKPVVTVVACRNMWLMAQETVKKLLQDCGARHCDHVALIDQGGPIATFITTPRWLLTGRKTPFWGLPPAGVASHDIDDASRFGAALAPALRKHEEKRDAPLLRGLRACVVDDRLIASEKIAKRSFRIWSLLLLKAGPPGTPLRRCLLAVYLVFLLVMLATVVPVTMLAKRLLRPLLRRRLQSLKTYFEAPSGSDDARLQSIQNVHE